MSQVFDCAIVGAGPSGGTAAYHLAKRGRSVLIVEKEALPRYKPCGGGVAPLVQDWFDFDFSPAVSVATRVNRYTWNCADPVEVEMNIQDPVWMVRREEFDYFLIQQAQRQGATLQAETLVTGVDTESDRIILQTAKGPVEARYLIAADGGRGPLAQWLGFKRRKRTLAGAWEAEIPVPDQSDRRIHFEFGLVESGYLWNFPKADGYSLGVGAFGDRGRQNLREILAQYARSFGVDLADATVQCGHPISLWNGNQDLHCDRAVLAGEAACVVDPFTAEGIRPSMFSGMKAAEAIDRALGGDANALANYSQTMAEEWGAQMAWAKRLAQFFYRFPGWTYQHGVKRPSASQTFGKLFSGELRYSDVVGKALDRMRAQLAGG